MPELVWEGKYDGNGRRISPLRMALPFQTVETVNESAQDRQRSLDLFGGGDQGEWRNRLIWGDKKYVLPSLVADLAGTVDLIYIDPPFDTGADFSIRASIDGEDFTRPPSVIEQKAYRDTGSPGLYARTGGATAVGAASALSSLQALRSRSSMPERRNLTERPSRRAGSSPLRARS